MFHGVSEARGWSSADRSRALLGIGVACLLAVGACARGQPKSQAPSPSDKVVDLNGDSQRNGKTRLRVENQNLNDMTIYAYQGSQRMRIGRARGNATTEMDIPSSFISGATQLRFMAEPMGNQRGFLSEPIPVTPGDIVDFYVPAR